MIMLTITSVPGRLQTFNYARAAPPAAHHLHSVPVVDNFDVVAGGWKLAIVKVAFLAMRYSQKCCR
jgi:hypothetical protein